MDDRIEIPEDLQHLIEKRIKGDRRDEQDCGDDVTGQQDEEAPTDSTQDGPISTAEVERRSGDRRQTDRCRSDDENTA